MGVKIKTTLGRRLHLIAMQFSVSRTVVENIVKAYIQSLIDDVLEGKDVTIDGFVSISVMKDTNGDPVLRGRVSDALKSKLENNNKE